jgi:iron complex transport system ATP-binding protein
MGELTATGLSWSVKRTLLLDEIDLVACDGQVVGLLGPNGSGKTTLLRLLAGLRRPDGGVVHLDGTGMDELGRRAIARRLAVVEQDTDVNGDLTVRQVVELGRTPFRGRFDVLTGEDQWIIDDALVRVGLTAKQHQSWHTLSGGEKQRAQLARALAQQPTEILLDEPTNHLDVRHQLELLELLRSLHVTCVLALHDLALAARYCDHIVLLDRGRVVATGPPGRVVAPDLIGKVYGVEALVDHEPSTGIVTVTYVAPISSQEGSSAPGAPTEDRRSRRGSSREPATPRS